LMSARNPLRYGLVAGRYPYLLACMGLFVLLEVVLRRQESRRGALAGLVLAFIFLSHSGLIPLMIVPGAFLAIRSFRAALAALGLSLLLVGPRLAAMIPLMAQVPEGPEAQTQGWASVGQIIIEPLRGLWGAIAVSPICQGAFVASALALVFVRRASVEANHLRSFGNRGFLWIFLVWAWVSGSGLFETLGLRGSLSHYGQRGYGLIVALVIVLGMSRLIAVRRRVAAVILLVMAAHGLGFGRMVLKERYFREYRGVAPDSFQVLQRLKQEGDRVGGLIPAAVLNGVIPFALTYGDVEYFPYFFPEKRMLVSFVPIPSFYRSIPEHVDIYGRWLQNPSDPAVVESLMALGLDTVWLPNVPQFASTLARIEADPSRYQPWFGFGRERVFRLLQAGQTLR